jgi:hypothetical protein
MKKEKKKERAGRWGCDVKLTPIVVGVKEGLIRSAYESQRMANGGLCFQPPLQRRKVKPYPVTIESGPLEESFLNLRNGSPDSPDLGKTVQ